jgi:Contractile injection system tube protein
MSTFPGSPKTLKGAIVGIDRLNPLASVIVFQYNPDTLTRKLVARAPAERGARSEAQRLHGAPAENIQVTVEIDATDQLEKAAGDATSMGIHPQLAALEMLLYPKSSAVIANTVLALAGTIEVLAVEAPMTFLIWGARRILPVRLTELNITEEAHDVNLNPIRAKVSFGLRVLTYSDLPLSHPGYYAFLAHQLVKETMAVIGSAGNIGAVAGGGIELL